MPTYVYECKTCEKVIEVQQRISDDPLKECLDECCGGELRRLIQAPSIVIGGGSAQPRPSTGFT